ncbi:MAG: hypothetical protein ACREB9_01200 [Thermoplasmata archaeon]
MDTEHLPVLHESDYLLLNVGVDQYVPFVVRRQALNEVVYDPVLQGALAGPQVPPGATPSAGQAANYVAQVQFGLLASETSITGVFDIFGALDTLEMDQVFFGISPRPHRAWVQQPTGTFVQGLEQNIVPSATYADVIDTDGFASPFGRPGAASEFFSLSTLSVTFALANPQPWPASPRFDFLINRLYVQPVNDPLTVQRLLKRAIPAHYFSMGNPKVNLPYAPQQYGGAKPLSSGAANLSTGSLVTLLARSGYGSAGGS